MVPAAEHVARPPAVVIVATPAAPTRLHVAVAPVMITLFWSRTSTAYWRVTPTSTVPEAGDDVTLIVIDAATLVVGGVRPPPGLPPHAGRITALAATTTKRERARR